MPTVTTSTLQHLLTSMSLSHGILNSYKLIVHVSLLNYDELACRNTNRRGAYLFLGNS